MSTRTKPNQRKFVFAGVDVSELKDIKLNGTILVKDDGYRELLRGLKGADTIYLDLETGSYDPKLDSLNPWLHCWPIGAAIAANDYGPAYYIPINKQNENEIYDLLFELLTDPRLVQWVNHNIKYDALVLRNCGGINLVNYPIKLVDTITAAKLIDSERFRYGLDHLSKDWLNEDISGYEAPFKPYLYRNKDYSAIPIDIISIYAGQDVITNRKLYKYICDNMPEECMSVWEMEIALTKILMEIEINGMQVNSKHLEATEIKNQIKLLDIEVKLEKITGRSFRPHTNADCFDILCNYYGLPVLKWTNGGDNTDDEEDIEDVDTSNCNASFDKHALTSYLSHPAVLADENKKQVVELISEYRKINTFNNLFVKKYRELIDSDGKLHPSYNQCVRTGRMACNKPNSMQLNKDAKGLILPYDGHLFVSYDYSQIEYRMIGHYIENPLILDKYNNDPNADFHEFVAELVKKETGLNGMTRSGGKTLNFGLGFNMGKKKLLRSLQGNKDLMNSLVIELNAAIEKGELQKEQFEDAFAAEAEKRAEAVFNGYHRAFPEMKQTSRKAEYVCKDRGYIRNLYNRRRHLEPRFAYKAFNTINQSSAADLMKSKMVEIGLLIKNSPIKIVASVHDEILFSMPRAFAEDTRITHTIAKILETPNLPEGRKLLVPIRVSMGIADNWKDASGSAKSLDYTDAVDIAVNLEMFNELISSSRL